MEVISKRKERIVPGKVTGLGGMGPGVLALLGGRDGEDLGDRLPQRWGLKIPDWLVKATLLEGAGSAVRLGMKPWFGGLAQVPPFSACGCLSNTRKPIR